MRDAKREEPSWDIAEFLTETIQPNKATCLNLLSFIVTCNTWIDNYTDYKKYNKEQENCQKMTQHIWKWTKLKGIEMKNEW